MSLSRRTFVAAGAATLLCPLARVRGANDDIRIGVIGVRGRGAGHIEQFDKIPGVRVTAICDPDAAALADRAKMLGDRPLLAVADMRRLFESKEIDAVTIATPNHWHALATIWACQAGKDVYVEKPASHTIREGRLMIEAAAKHKRIVQVGTQRRSDPGFFAVVDYLKGGELGRVHRVRVLHYSVRESIGTVDGPQQPPKSVDYNLWAGPAPMSPIMRRQFHYDWHWFWETGNGEIGNNCPHTADLARWALGDAPRWPSRVLSIGGRFGWGDSGQTPNTQLVMLDYGDDAGKGHPPIYIEVRNLPKAAGERRADFWKSGASVGVIIECEHGFISGLEGGAAFDHEGNRIKAMPGDGGRDHAANFIKAVRSRNEADLNAPILEGHLSAGVCHLANISHRLGAAAPPDQIRATVKDDAQMAEAFDRFAAHLDANKIDVDKSPVTLGPALQFDTKTEQFVGESVQLGANAHLTRPYRAPFIVPDQV